MYQQLTSTSVFNLDDVPAIQDFDCNSDECAPNCAPGWEKFDGKCTYTVQPFCRNSSFLMFYWPFERIHIPALTNWRCYWNESVSCLLFGSTAIPGKCYFWSQEKLFWGAAELKCRAMGGHLASVTSSDTHDFLHTHVRKCKRFSESI